MIDRTAATLAVLLCATAAHAQDISPAADHAAAGIYTLGQALHDAAEAAPALQAASSAVQSARLGATIAGLRPNPVAQGQIENIVGSGIYRGVRSAESTIGLAFPIETGGKRASRVAAADARTAQAVLQAAAAAADIRLQVTQLYFDALAAQRRLAAAREQLRIADDGLRAADVRVRAGRASPIEQQRAGLARITAEAAVERTMRQLEGARVNLARRTGHPTPDALDAALLDHIPPATNGPVAPATAGGTLALAAADAGVAIADADVRLARSARVPDLNVGPALRRLEATNDTAAVLSLSVPIPLFNAGRAAVSQAAAEQIRAAALRRVTALDVEQAITDATIDAANAAAGARTAAGPSLAAAQEAARIARIGYREGKFGQLDLLEAERALAETRLAAIEAMAAWRLALARLDRLTTPAPETAS